MHDDDRLLRKQLQDADPAHDLAPVPPTWLDHRMEQIMSDSTPTAAPAEPARRTRRVWIPIAGAAAVALAAAIALPLALGGAPTTQQLALPDDDGGIASGSCLPVSADLLVDQEQAFAARVISVDGDTVTLEVTERFAGEVADRIEVAQNDAMDSDFSAVVFEQGETYLITAGDGTIRGCGLSGEDSPELRAIYDEAFGG
jgi:hypothetical protein